MREAVDEKRAGDAPVGPAGKSGEQLAAEWLAWVESHPPVTHFVDDSRDSIYAGRGE